MVIIVTAIVIFVGITASLGFPVAAWLGRWLCVAKNANNDDHARV